jgi:hypothetical protein
MYHRSKSINAELAGLEPGWVPAPEIEAPDEDSPDRHADIVRENIDETETEFDGATGSEPNGGVDLFALF